MTVSQEIPVLDCDGYRSLAAAVELDIAKGPSSGRKPEEFRAKLTWAVERARHYAEKTGLRAEDILDSWERDRRYWYLNYYQECNQPAIKSDLVRVFETVAELLESIGQAGFRCPACSGVSRSPYECDSGMELERGKKCDWKVYGLFGHLGKGLTVFVKELLKGNAIFMPIAWETSVDDTEGLSKGGGS